MRSTEALYQYSSHYHFRGRSYSRVHRCGYGDRSQLIVDFVDGIYDTFDADHSESLEFDEVMQALQKSPEIDVWEVFGRTLINSS